MTPRPSVHHKLPVGGLQADWLPRQHHDLADRYGFAAARRRAQSCQPGGRQTSASAIGRPSTAAVRESNCRRRWRRDSRGSSLWAPYEPHGRPTNGRADRGRPSVGCPKVRLGTVQQQRFHEGDLTECLECLARNIANDGTSHHLVLKNHTNHCDISVIMGPDNHIFYQIKSSVTRVGAIIWNVRRLNSAACIYKRLYTSCRVI